MSEHIDEEGLLKLIKFNELSRDITRLNWTWDDRFDSITKAHELMIREQKLFLEISEYKQRMGERISPRQRKDIEDTIEGLGRLVNYLKDKIKPSELRINALSA
jgi:hypothetical protein